MKRIKNFFQREKEVFLSYTFPEKLLFLNSVSIFLPFFLSAVPLLITVIISLLNKSIRKEIFAVSYWKAFLIFTLIGVLSPIVNQNLLGVGGGIFMFVLMLFSFLSRAFMTEKLWDKITENICNLSILSFIIGVIDYTVRYSPDSEHRTASTFFNANYYAFIVEIIVVLCVYKITKNPGKWYKYLGIALVNCSAILICKTRTALVAVFIGILAYFFFSKKWKIVGVVSGVIGVAVLATIISPETFLPRYETFFWSLNDRFEIWKTAVEGLLYRPIFGQGLWAYWRLYDIFGGRFAVNAHCIWLDTFLSFGIAGTIAIFYYFIRATIKGVKRLDLREKAALLALILTVLAHCTIDLAITGVETSIMAMLLYGIVGNGKKEEA